MTPHRIAGGWLRRALLGTTLCVGVIAQSFASADEFRPGTTTLISKGQSGQVADGGNPSVSSDGRYVAFESWDRLSTEDTDDSMDIYRYDRITGQTIMVSVNASGLSSTSCNFEPSISGDGTQVAYRAGGGGGGTIGRGCYTGYAVLRNIDAGTSNYVPGTGASRAIDLSKDGRYLAILYDNSSNYRVAVLDLATGTRPWESGIICEECVIPAPETVTISSDGRFIAYEAILASSDVFLHDRDTDGNGIFDESGRTSTQQIDVERPGSWAAFPSVSDDGKTVAFVAADRTLGGPMVQTYLRNLNNNTTELISQSSVGIQGSGVDSRAGWQMGFAPSVSSNGRYVAFSSQDPFLPPGDANPSLDVFVRDRQVNKTYLVSAVQDGTQNLGFDAAYASISSDGNFISFSHELAGVQADNNFFRSAYLRDLWTECINTCLPNPSFVPPDPPPPPTLPSLPGCTASGTTRTCSYTAASSSTRWTGAANWWCVTVYQALTSSIRTERCHSYFDGVYSGTISSVPGDRVKVSVYDVSGVAAGAVHAQDG